MMFTINDVITEYRRLDRVLGVDTSRIPVTVSKRFTRKLGMCRFEVTRGGSLEVTIL